MVTRRLIACLTFLTRVQNIGLSNIRFDFDGRYTESPSDSDSDAESLVFLPLKKFARIDCFKFIVNGLLSGLISMLTVDSRLINK